MRKIKDFKKGIFSLRTNFGELAQIMIAELYGFEKSNSKYYDLVGSNQERIEVKFSRAYERKMKMTHENAIKICMMGTKLQNVVKSSEAEKRKYDCNIQQIKSKEFDYLYYGIFFKDQIEIFCVSASNVNNMPASSDKQHKGNEGEGQFHIKPTNISKHRKEYLRAVITYEKLYSLLDKS